MAHLPEVGANTVRLAHYQHSPWPFLLTHLRPARGLGGRPRSRSSLVMNPPLGAHENRLPEARMKEADR